MARKLDVEKKLPPGWAERREPKEETPIKSLTSQAAIDGWIEKASARSGPKFAPGTKSS
jgi:hypothetical protein